MKIVLNDGSEYVITDNALVDICRDYGYETVQGFVEAVVKFYNLGQEDYEKVILQYDGPIHKFLPWNSLEDLYKGIKQIG